MTATVALRGLSVDYRLARGLRRAVDAVDLEIAPGEAHGLVGESGSGKSSVAFALTGHVPAGARVTAERAVVAGRDILTLRGTPLRDYRRSEIGVVYQEPGRALDPTATVGTQLAEAHRLRGLARGDIRAAVLRSLGHVGLARADAVARRYPHELSGGQQQRIVIAMALAGRPRLLILDEPTTGLDSSVQADVLALIDRLRAEVGFSTLLISHDLHLVAAHSDRVSVMQSGRILETTDARSLTSRPAHAYTRALIRALPGIDDPTRAASPDRPTVLRARDLGVSYGGTVALAGVDLELRQGETLAVVGESGSGKSTLGRALAGLVRHTGEVVIDAPTAPPPVQVVFQSPDASLNPRRSVAQTLGRAARLLGGDLSPVELADRVGLPEDVLGKLPHQLSGGQKQRVAIARAFAGRAPIVVCDEPTSALDVSVQARVLDLLVELQERTGVAYLFITHDLAVVRGIAHRVVVLRDGRVQETAPTERLFAAPEHPYTRTLLAAASGRPASGDTARGASVSAG